MPYPDVLQCRNSKVEAVVIKHDVAVAADGAVTSSYAVNAPCGTKDIYLAACDGDTVALDMFLRMGVDINSIGRPTQRYGTTFDRCSHFCATPLCFAAAYGREKAVAFLLEKGADAFRTSSTGIRPWEYARHRRYRIIMDMLQTAEEKQRANAKPTLPQG
ncbi:ankyrin repeat protein, putative [Trypanosoma equiperdum]|uniref:Ankyrin repeat protein, putative n=2 Tax=Trypanozoon TaxID=39700 RepID=Q382U5_TRYB2|nr:uncharacterized protein Tb11.01.4180 [Trypanosoma brucei brucei TREU927]EAN80186.1 ankyrin repeat protein, putative [Trypanosoma brucei brucei TREU927]SCU65413.1 ankyrin repeat protein, putative [Trypanosoma equiperdum]